MSQTTQGHHPLQFKNAWRQFIAENLRVKQMTKRALCRRAAIDPSYVTLFCRDGYIPKRDVVERVGLALGSIDEALRAAGYLEDGVPHDTPSLAGLSQESLRLLSALASGFHATSMALREDYRLEAEQLRPQVEKLKAELAKAQEARNAEEDSRLSLEEQIHDDLNAAQKALGRAALRMLSLLDRVSPQ